MRSDQQEHRIVVLGAGYTGITAAIRTAGRTRRHGGRVTLVNPSTRFYERLRSHQIATGQQLADHQIPDLIADTGIEFVQGRATGIDTERREIHLDIPAGARVLDYDTLVYAIGSFTDTTTAPGAADHAYTLNGPQAAARLAERLTEVAADGGTVTVCGSGLTGVEAATEIADTYPAVRVVLLGRDRPGSMLGGRARRHLDRALDRLGIEVRAGVEVAKVLPDGVELADGESVSCAACLWTTGFHAASLAAQSGIAVDEQGRIVVDATLRSVSHPSVYAVGDSAAIRQPWGEIHGTCQSGLPTAAHAADSIAHRLKGKKAKPFRFGYIHQPLSLGRHDAVIQFTRPDDTPRRWYLKGRSAIAYKEFVSSSPPTTYRLMRRFPGALVWPRGGRRTRRPLPVK